MQVVVVTRHPLDNIARMVAAPKRAAPAEADEAALAREETAFFTMAAAVERLAGETDIHWMGHEDFVSDPVAGLTGLLGRLDLDVDDDYVTAATSIVNDSPRLARHAISWPDGQCQSIMERASAFAFLRRYC
jgi:hypothetical protein